MLTFHKNKLKYLCSITKSVVLVSSDINISFYYLRINVLCSKLCKKEIYWRWLTCSKRNNTHIHALNTKQFT